jgi:CHASE1-domain containing sensor protein
MAMLKSARPEGERAFYTAVVYIEPVTGRNLRAFGYDMALEPVRWQAAERARDQGEPSLSGKVRLQQDGQTDAEPGFLLFVPVYRRKSIPATVDERRANLLGWAYLLMRKNELMKGVLGTIGLDVRHSRLRVEVCDGDRQAPEARLFELAPGVAGSTLALALRAVRRLDLGGHQ